MNLDRARRASSGKLCLVRLVAYRSSGIRSAREQHIQPTDCIPANALFKDFHASAVVNEGLRLSRCRGDQGAGLHRLRTRLSGLRPAMRRTQSMLHERGARPPRCRTDAKLSCKLFCACGTVLCTVGKFSFGFVRTCTVKEPRRRAPRWRRKRTIVRPHQQAVRLTQQQQQQQQRRQQRILVAEHCSQQWQQQSMAHSL